MNVYGTLAALRRTLGLADAQTSDDDLLQRVLVAASRLVDTFTGRRFYPTQDTRVYTFQTPGSLLLDSDLLALESLTNGDGSAIAAELLHLHPAGSAVKSSVVLDRTQTAFVHDGDPVDAIQVSGTWGFHPDWDAAWADSGDTVQDAALSASDTTITVTDADAVDTAGWARFQVGHLLRIEDEYLHVLAVDATANTLTVARGVNGTTAASHAQNTTIDVYQPPADIAQVCLRVAAWLYKQKDAGFVQQTGGLRGQIAVPPAIPADVAQVLAPYARVRVG